MLLSVDASAVPTRAGGVGRYLTGLLAALDRRSDVAVVVVCGRGDGARWSRAAPGSRVNDLAPRWAPARLAWEQAALPWLLGRMRPMVHHSPHYTLPRRSSVPKVVTVHDMTFFDHPEWHSRAKVVFFREAIRTAARRADALVCVSRTTADRLSALLSPACPVVVAPHGVETSRFSPHEDPSRPDASILGTLGVRIPYVAFVGTVEPRKDVPTLVRAFDRVSPSHPQASLVIAGAPGWDEARLSETIRHAAHPERIRRLGYVDDAWLPALLRQATAVVYPSVEEGFGLPVLEALACGAPTITTRGTAMEEFAGGAAFLFDAGDCDALSELLDAVLAGGLPGLDVRRAAGVAAARAHTWEASAEHHMLAYRLAAGFAG